MYAERANVGQIELQFRVYDHPGDAIIFLHFSGANLMMWQRAVPYFLAGFRLVLVDLRGHGKSACTAIGYHMDDMAGDILGLMRHLGLERAHIVGSSLGAEVGLSLAAHHPQHILSLVCDGALSNEYGPYGTWENSRAEFEAYVADQLAKMHAAPEAVYPSIDALVERSRQGLSEMGWWNEYVEAMLRYGAWQLAEGQYVEAFRKSAREEYFRHYFHYHLEDYYEKIECPTLLLPGEDVFANEREERAMQGLCVLAPHAQIARVSGWEHPYGWLIDPTGVCQAILKFLEGATEKAGKSGKMVD